MKNTLKNKYTMNIIYNYLLDKGFKSNKNSIFTYSFTIEGFAYYKIVITSYNNWVFRMETEKKSLSKGVVGFSNHTCFFGVISSEDSIIILDILLSATGIEAILQNHKIHKLMKEEQ